MADKLQLWSLGVLNMPTIGDEIREFLRGQWIYAQHAVGLVFPGHPPDVYQAHQVSPGDMQGWDDVDLDLLIEEGRRQLDEQFTTLERTRTRAQLVFVTSLALLGSLGGLLTSVAEGSILFKVSWVASAISGTWSLLGAAGVMTVTATFSAIDSAVLSNYPTPIKSQLARDYAEMLCDGENTVATRLTVHRTAVTWLVIGAYLALGAWVLG